MNSRLVESIERVVIKMYQIYSMLGLMAIVWGVAIWASLPEEQEDIRHEPPTRPSSSGGVRHVTGMQLPLAVRLRRV